MSLLLVLGGILTLIIGITSFFYRDFPKRTATYIIIVSIFAIALGFYILPADTLMFEQGVQQILQQTSVP